MIHVFQDCELDEELFQLRRRGKRIKLEPKVFDVLLYLLRHRDRVVAKDELLQELWDGAVSESVLPSCVAALRRAVGDDRARGRVIQTVYGRGYRFVAEVAERPPAVPASQIGSASGASAFVGRESALEQLCAALSSALAGSGRLLLLVGEPGIGKTRTAEELGGEARRRGARVLTGRCHEGAGAPAFWPWMRALRQLACEEGREALVSDMGPGASEIAELVPELRDPSETASPGAFADEEQARFRLFDSVTTFLSRASARRPIVLVLDDLHWADEASLRLLGFLAGEIPDSHLLVIGTYRDVDVRRGHPLAELLGALARERCCERIALRGLDREATARLVEALAGEPTGGLGSLAATVWEMTEGNPFFIREVADLLLRHGDLEALRGGADAALALPQSVRDAIGRRLDALSGDCNRLLGVASLLGREFSGALLERVADVESERLLRLVDEAVAAGVLVESEDGVGGYAFGHALIRQTLYEEIETPERVRLHRRAGEVIEELSGAHPDPHLAELAHHFYESAIAYEGDEAVRYCVLAAERARGLLAYEAAARQYERALRVLELRPPRDETRRVELLLALAEARWISGERAAAQAAFGAAAEIARRLGRADLLARAAAGTRLFDMGTPPPEATRALIEEALAALGDDHPALRSRLLSRLVGMPPHSHSMERREALSREARKLAVRSGDDEALRDALFARRWACLGPDRVDERFENAEEFLDLAERKNDVGLAALAHDVLHGAHLIRGEAEEADRALAAYTRIAHELRQPHLLSMALVWQGSRALARAEFDEAEHLIREAYERGRRSQERADFVHAGQRYFLREARGDEDTPEERQLFFGEMMQLPYSWAPAVRAALAVTHVFAGRDELARREFEELAKGDFRDLPRDEHWLPFVGALGRVASELRDERRGALLYELLTPYADLMMIHDLLRANIGCTAGVLGNLATTLGRHDEAALHFENAIARETAMEARTAAPRSKAGLARLLLLRGAAGDRGRAEALADEVRAEQRARGIAGNRRLEREIDELRSAPVGVS